MFNKPGVFVNVFSRHVVREMQNSTSSRKLKKKNMICLEKTQDPHSTFKCVQFITQKHN